MGYSYEISLLESEIVSSVDLKTKRSMKLQNNFFRRISFKNL